MGKIGNVLVFDAVEFALQFARALRAQCPDRSIEAASASFACDQPRAARNFRICGPTDWCRLSALLVGHVAIKPIRTFRAISPRPQEMDYRNFRYAVSEIPIMPDSILHGTSLTLSFFLKRGNQPTEILDQRWWSGKASAKRHCIASFLNPL